MSRFQNMKLINEEHQKLRTHFKCQGLQLTILVAPWPDTNNDSIEEVVCGAASPGSVTAACKLFSI